MGAKKDRKLIRYLPMVVGVVVGVFWYCFNRGAVTHIETYQLIATLSATLLGLFVVAKSVILNINDGYYYKLIRGSEHFKNAMISFRISMIYTLLALIYCVIIIFCGSIGAAQSLILVGVTAGFLTAVVMNIFIYELLTEVAAQEKQKNKKN